MAVELVEVEGQRDEDPPADRSGGGPGPGPGRGPDAGAYVRAVSGLDWMLGIVIAAQLRVPTSARPALRELLARTPMAVKVDQVVRLLGPGSPLGPALREAASLRTYLDHGARSGRVPTDRVAEAVTRAERSRIALLLVADAVVSGWPEEDLQDVDWWSRAGRRLDAGGVVPVSPALSELLAAV